MSVWEKDPAVQRFRQYLQIPSVHPDVDYGEVNIFHFTSGKADGCVEFLRGQARALQLPVKVHELVARKPVVVITWPGSRLELPAILLNSHMDVVPVSKEFWTYPPFEARISADGYIYARGAQDMKSVGMFHLEAVRRLKEAGVTLKRTVHVCFVPDEEIGGVDGMKKFAQSEEFKALNIGFALDESSPTPDTKTILAFYGEKVNKQIKITCKGKPGHGSLLPGDTAGEKLHFIIDKFMKYRMEEKKKHDGGVYIGDVTSINLTQIEGGVQVNVIPDSLSVSFDVRVPLAEHAAFDDMVKKWCTEAGKDVTFKFLKDDPVIQDSKIDKSNLFWTSLNVAVEDMGLKTDPAICCGTTDARFVRQQGIPTIGLSPLLGTPVLLHAHDERIHVDAYRRGIDIMETILRAIATV